MHRYGSYFLSMQQYKNPHKRVSTSPRRNYTKRRWRLYTPYIYIFVQLKRERQRKTGPFLTFSKEFCKLQLHDFLFTYIMNTTGNAERIGSCALESCLSWNVPWLFGLCDHWEDKTATIKRKDGHKIFAKQFH